MKESVLLIVTLAVLLAGTLGYAAVLQLTKATQEITWHVNL